MSSANEIERSVKTMIETVKSNVSRSLLTAIANNEVIVNTTQLEKLIKIVEASIDSSYHRASGEVSRAINQSGK